MKASVFVFMMIVVFTLSYLPVIIASIEPIKTTVNSVNFTLYEDIYVKYEFSLYLLVNLSPVPLSLVGIFLAYCIYKAQSCAWRTERIKDTKYLPMFYDD